MRGEIAEAKNSFVRYLQSFPQGAFSVNASYYLGVIAYNQQDYASASSWLDKVLEYPDSKFSTEAMGMSADIAYKGKDYPKALGLYKRMADGPCFVTGRTPAGRNGSIAQCMDGQ